MTIIPAQRWSNVWWVASSLDETPSRQFSKMAAKSGIQLDRQIYISRKYFLYSVSISHGPLFTLNKFSYQVHSAQDRLLLSKYTSKAQIFLRYQTNTLLILKINPSILDTIQFEIRQLFSNMSVMIHITSLAIVSGWIVWKRKWHKIKLFFTYL